MNKNLLSVMILSAACLALIFFLAYSEQKQDKQQCNNVEVEITDSEEMGFVTDADIINEMTEFEGGMLGKSFDDINMQMFENKLNTKDHIDNAEVYSTIDGVVHVKLSQRQPIIRLMCQNGAQYYMDSKAKILPVSEQFSAPVLLANGFIPDPGEEELKKNKVCKELLKLGNWVSEHPFWLEMIQQVYVEENSDIILITRIGDHKVTLGSADELDSKFEKLMAFYKGGLNRTGWNKYTDINLKYRDQVVCSKTQH